MVDPSLTFTTVESFFSDVSGAISLGRRVLTSSSEYLKLLTEGLIRKIISLFSVFIDN